jgi:hypothetical protein
MNFERTMRNRPLPQTFCRKTRVAVATAIGLWSLFAATDAEAKCVIGHDAYFNFSSPGPWTYSMKVSPRKPCGHHFHSPPTVAFKRLYVATQPLHGSIILRQGGHYAYVSKADYRGADAFALRICGSERGADKCITLQFSVRVE